MMPVRETPLCSWQCCISSLMLSCLGKSPSGSSVHGILQARILEKVDIFFSRGSSWSRDRTQVSCMAGRFFTIWATREAQYSNETKNNPRKLSFDFNFLKIVKTDTWSIWRFCHLSFHSPSDSVSLITTWPAALVYHQKMPCRSHFYHCSPHFNGIPGGHP